MKQICLSFILVFSAIFVQAQDPDLIDFNKMRLKKTQTAMTILSGWAVVNIGSGLILQANTTGEDKYFHQMNAAWNSVNLVIAGMGYFRAKNTDPGSFNLAQTVHEYHKIQKVLIFNAGLDLAYVAAGFYIMELGNSRGTGIGRAKARGWGKSIAVQGGFLFLFDMTTAFFLSADTPRLNRLLSAISFNGNQLGLCWQF